MRPRHRHRHPVRRRRVRRRPRRPRQSAGGAHLAQVIGERLSEPIDVGRGQIRIGASIGVALFPDHGDTPETLPRAADAAMYEAKKTRNGAPAPAAADTAATARQAVSSA